MRTRLMENKLFRMAVVVLLVMLASVIGGSGRRVEANQTD